MAGHQTLKLSEELVVKDLIFALEKGASYMLACKNAGVSYVQFRDFIIRCEKYIATGLDEKGNVVDSSNPLLKNYHRINKAVSKRAMVWLDILENAAPKNWQAAAWKLERCHPEDYSKQNPILEEKMDNSVKDIKEIKELVHSCMQPMKKI